MPEPAKQRPPRRGSRAWEEALARDPEFVKHRLLSLAEDARRGDKAAAQKALALVEELPGLRAAVRALDGLIESTVGVWAAAIAEGDALAEAAVRAEAVAMLAGLVGPNPPAVDLALAGDVIVSHLAHQHALRVAAKPASSPGWAAQRDRRVESTQRRLDHARRVWEAVSSRRASAHKPTLTIFSPDAGRAT